MAPLVLVLVLVLGFESSPCSRNWWTGSLPSLRSGETKFDMQSRTTTRTRTRTMAAKARRSERYGLARVKGIPRIEPFGSCPYRLCVLPNGASAGSDIWCSKNAIWRYLGGSTPLHESECGNSGKSRIRSNSGQWCSGGDLNPQGLAPTSPSSWRVCQFHHPSR
jgi:hypothetical protein